MLTFDLTIVYLRVSEDLKYRLISIHIKARLMSITSSWTRIIRPVKEVISKFEKSLKI